MAKKAAKVIDVIKHKSGIEAEIKLSPDTLMFYCSSETIGNKIENKDGNIVRELVTKALNDAAQVQWQGVIEAVYTTRPQFKNRYDGIKVEIQTRRYWLSLASNTKLICEQWDYMFSGLDRRLSWAKHWTSEASEIPYHKTISTDSYFNSDLYSIYPYTDELWERLEYTKQCIKLSNEYLVAALRGDLDALCKVQPILPIPLVKEL